MEQIFSRDPDLVKTLNQARADNDLEEISMLVCRFRVFLEFVQSLAKCKSYEDVATSAMDYLPQVFESDRVYMLFPKSGASSSVWTLLRRDGSRVFLSKQHCGVHGQVQHTAKPVIIEDVDDCKTYKKQIEFETKASFGTRCIMAVPVFYEPQKKSGWTGESYLEKSIDSVPPSFEPKPGKMHSKPIIAIIEALNKRIRPGHGLLDDDLEAKATAAAFNEADLALSQIVARSIGAAISRVCNEEAITTQTQFLNKVSTLVPRFFKLAASENLDADHDHKNIGANTNSVEAIYGMNSPEVVLPVLEEMCNELTGSRATRIFVNSRINEEQVCVPGKISTLTAADLLEQKLLENPKAEGHRPRSRSEGAQASQETTLSLTLSAASSEVSSDTDVDIAKHFHYISSTIVISENGARKKVVRRKGITHFDSSPVGITGWVLRTGKAVYVSDSYNNPMWNGNADQDAKGSGMICCPIKNSENVMLGICQVAVHGDAHLEQLALMTPTRMSGAYTELDSQGQPNYRGRRGVRTSARDKIISCAVGAIKTVCSQFTTIIDYYNNILHAQHRQILHDEKQLTRLFKYWAWSVVGQKEIKRVEMQNLCSHTEILKIENPKSPSNLLCSSTDTANLNISQSDSKNSELVFSSEKNEYQGSNTDDKKLPLKDHAFHPEKKHNLWQAVYDPSSGHYYYYDSVADPMCQCPTWDKPEGFDLDASREAEKNISAGGLSLSEVPHGLALLLATRKIQNVFRAKQARKKMRVKRAEKFVESRPNTPADVGMSEWIEMMDHGSGYPYYYNTHTHETTWDDPRPIEATNNSDEKHNNKESGEMSKHVDEPKQKDSGAAMWQAVYDPSSGHYYYYDSVADPMCQCPTWDKPEGFDLDASREAEKNISAGGLSLSEVPHGLALLLATRKIQNVFRAKQARKKMRVKRAEKFVESRPNTPADVGMSEWIEMMDHGSGYPYYYNTHTHETTWDDPRPRRIDFNDLDTLAKQRVESIAMALESAVSLESLIEIQSMIPEDERIFDAVREDAKKLIASMSEGNAHI